VLRIRKTSKSTEEVDVMSTFGKLFAGMFVLVALLSAPIEAQPGGRAARGEVVLGHKDDAQSLDPRRGRITPDRRLTTLIYSSLVRATAKGIVPDLAERWETPSPTIYIFHLRRGVRFHDGNELTADDVKYTYDTIRDPAFASPDLSTFRVIRNITTDGRYEVRFELSASFAPFLSELIRGIVPKAYAEANPANVNLRPIGSGPFKFVEWIPNTRIVLEANPAYYGGAPKIRRLTLLPIPDTTVRMLQFETGEIDAVFSFAPSSQILRAIASKKYNVQEVPGSTANFIQLNINRPPLNDRRVRQAIAYAIDRRQIARFIYLGMSVPASSPVLPSSPFYERDTDPMTYNEQRARTLLREAGMEKGFTIELEPVADLERQQYSELIQRQLAKVGINVVLKPREAATIVRDWVTANYDMITFGLGNAPDPDSILYRRFHSSQFPPAGVNAGYRNSEVDRLLDQARTTMDQAARKRLYSQAQKIIVSDVPIIILNYGPEHIIAHTRLKDATYDPFSLFFDLGTKAYWAR
jgi:peptide/nickel transport system substrate-binding protein